MYKSNAYYGNAVVLAGYAQQREVMFPPTIPGFVQPDLTTFVRPEQAPGVPTFVWGSAAMAARRARGLRNHSPIGSPWLYLLEQESRNRIPQTPLKEHLRPTAEAIGDVLYFPHHGLLGVHAARDHARRMAQEFPGQAITVALSHEQFASADTVAAYTDAGLTPVSLGPATLDVGSAEPYLMYRLLLLLRAHRSVVCDVRGQMALFAHAAGLPVSVRSGEEHTSGILDELARTHLGTDCVMPARELRALFDWSHHA